MENFFDDDLKLSDYNRKNLLKWRVIKDPNVLPFWVADMDFKVPPAVQKALSTQAAEGRFGYGAVPEELNEVICQRLLKLYGWKVTPDEIFWKSGVVPFLNLISRTFGGVNGRVLVPVPVYYHLFQAPDWGGQQTVRIPFVQQTSKIDFDWSRIEAEMQKGVKLFSLCNPHNPGGMVFRSWQLEKLIDLCEKYDALICSDEIHCDHILEEGLKHIPIASLDQRAARRTLTLMAPSKTFNLAGLGASFCVVQNPDLMQKLQAAAKGILPDAPISGYRAALAAYQESSAWLEELIRYLRSNRDLLYDFFDRSDHFSMQKPHEATYLAWVKLNKIPASEVSSLFLKFGVYISDGKIFDGAGYFRFNFGCHRKTLLEGLKRIEKGITAL